jgi:hypothetical protein
MQSLSKYPQDATYQKELHISWKKPEGGTKLVILNLNDGDFYSLEDPVSIQIWEKLMAGLTLRAVLDHLGRRYPEQDPATLGRDLGGFVGQLLADRLICPCPRPGAST